MKIAIMGAGGIGAYLGALLARAGEDVTLICRGAHLAAIRRDGLQVITREGNFRVPSVRATDDPSSVGPVDVILQCVKLYDVAARCAPRQIRVTSSPARASKAPR